MTTLIAARAALLESAEALIAACVADAEMREPAGHAARFAARIALGTCAEPRAIVVTRTTAAGSRELLYTADPRRGGGFALAAWL